MYLLNSSTLYTCRHGYILVTWINGVFILQFFKVMQPHTECIVGF